MRKFIEKVVYNEFDQDRLEDALRELIVDMIDYDELAGEIADAHRCEISEIISECVETLF